MLQPIQNKHHLNRPYANRGARPSAGRANPDAAASLRPQKLSHHWRTTCTRKSAPKGMRPASKAALAARQAYGW